MSVECYALVEFQKSYNDSMRELVLKLCRIRLVQGKGKNGSVPKPAWEVVEEIENCGRVSEEDIRELEIGGNIKLGRIYAKYKDYNLLTDKKRWFLAGSYDRDTGIHTDTYVTKSITILWKRTVNLSHIRYLFPECATMPFAIALDYVRDKL